MALKGRKGHEEWARQRPVVVIERLLFGVTNRSICEKLPVNFFIFRLTHREINDQMIQKIYTQNDTTSERECRVTCDGTRRIISDANFRWRKYPHEQGSFNIRVTETQDKSDFTVLETIVRVNSADCVC